MKLKKMKMLDLPFAKSLVPGTCSFCLLFKSGCLLSQQFELGILICLIALETLQPRPSASDSSALTKEKLLLSNPLVTLKIYKNKGSFSQYLRQRGNIVQEFLGFFPQNTPL